MNKTKVIKIAENGKLDTRFLDKAHYIIRNMREADAEEIRAEGDTPENGVMESILSSAECFMAIKENPLCVYGVAETAEGTTIWMLASKDIDNAHKDLVGIGMDYINEKVKEYGLVYNYISEKNTKALRYIKHAGAEFTGRVNINGTEFIRFEIRR